MFDFLRRSRRPELSAAMRQALVDERQPDGFNPDQLNVVQRRGSYSGRTVDYFRIFDPAAASAAGLVPHKFEDFDKHAELIFRAGHVESGGAVVLTPRPTTQSSPLPSRLLADRGAHGDDERVVFPGQATS